jgi:hypothetical protein
MPTRILPKILVRVELAHAAVLPGGIDQPMRWTNIPARRTRKSRSAGAKSISPMARRGSAIQS